MESLVTALTAKTDCEPELKSGLLELLSSWKDKPGFPLTKYNKEYVRVLLELFLLEDRPVSNQVSLVLTDCLNCEPPSSSGPPQDLFDVESRDLVKERLMPSLLKTLEDTKKPEVLRHWAVIVRLLGTHLHSGADLINKIMTVVQKAFKFPETEEESFRAWTALMDNFALDQNTLLKVNRLTLLMKPLIQKNVTSESGVKVKFEAWWHMIVLLGPSVHHYLEVVVLPFLAFCYGPKLDSKGGETPQKSPGTPQTPAKSHSGLERLCLDALVQLFCARPLSDSLPRCSLSGCLTAPAFQALQVAVHAEEVLYCLVEATRSVKPANRSHLLILRQVWAGLVDHFRQVKESAGEDKLYSRGYNQLLRAVKMLTVQLRRTERLTPLLVWILNCVSKLEPRSLTSNNDKPNLVLLELLLYPDFLENSTKTAEPETHSLYLETFTQLVSSLLLPPASLSQLGGVVERLEVSQTSLTASGLAVLNTVWQRLVTESVLSLDNLSEPAGPVTSFTSALSLLKFPASYLAVRGGDLKTCTVWARLYRAVVEQAEVSIHHTTGYITGELADRLDNVLRSRQTGDQILLTARLLRLMVEEVDWPSVARSLKVGGGRPLANFEQMMNPLGNITGLINLLRHCTDLLNNKTRETIDTDIAKELLKSYQKVFSINNQDLIRPILKLGTSSTFSLFLEEKLLVDLSTQDATVMTAVEKTFKTLVTLIKVKYNKEYTEDFLIEIKTFLTVSLQSDRNSFRTEANEMWAVTFGSLAKEKLPEDMKTVLKNSSSAGARAQVVSSEESSGSLTQQMTAEPAILVGLRKSARDSALKTPNNPAVEPEKPRPRKSLNLRLEDEDSAMFVPITTPKSKKRVLTEHQRDVLTSRHDDIPALYSELSRDDSNILLPPEFSSQDSEDSASQSLLHSLKSRKNQRFEMPDAGRALRRGRSSTSKQPDSKKEEKVESSQKDIFEDSSEEFKQPGDSIINESERPVDNSDTGANSSQSSVEEVIESSQDVTMESDEKPRRRSRRKTLDQVDSKTEEVAKENSISGLNKWGETALFIAVKKGDVKKVEDLISQDADPNLANFSGIYPLHEAAVSGKVEAGRIIDLLSSHGGTVDCLSTAGLSPLHSALSRGTVEQVRALLRAGADVGLETRDGLSVFSLAQQAADTKMMDVLREEREEYFEQNQTKRLCVETTGGAGTVEPVVENKLEEMECDPPAQEAVPPGDSDSDFEVETTEEKKMSPAKEGSQEVETKVEVKVSPLDSCNSLESNKENVSSEEAEEEADDADIKKPAMIRPKEPVKICKSPFTSVNIKQQKQKKPVTPGGSSRGAMLLNLSRKVGLEPSSVTSPTQAPSLAPCLQPSLSMVSVSPMRPWVKYAPSPSHASPSAGILKRPADELDSSTEASPISAKRIRLDSSAPKRVHFNDNPVSESVEIPRTPKQQKPRKKLLSALTDQEDKEDEMEGVTSLVMFPQLVDNKDSITNIQHQLATGQWARCLEQDLKKNEISTIGDLAGLDNNAVSRLRGIKPPKPQTVKLALGLYYNKVRREENVVRKGTPVQEETTQEEEDRIKEDIFSRPSPSPTDMADIDTREEEQEDNTEQEKSVKTALDIESLGVQSEEIIDQKAEDSVKTVPDTASLDVQNENIVDTSENSVKTVPDAESFDPQTEDKTEDKSKVESEVETEVNAQVNAQVNAEVKTEDNTEEKEEKAEDAVNTVPDTESFEGQTEEKINETAEREEVREKSPCKSIIEDAAPVVIEDTGHNEKHEEDVQVTGEAMEVEASENKNSSVRVEDTPDSITSVEEQAETLEPVEEVVEMKDNIANTVNLTDIVSLVNDDDVEPENLSNGDLKTLLTNLFDHSRKVEAMKKKVVLVLANRLN